MSWGRSDGLQLIRGPFGRVQQHEDPALEPPESGGSLGSQARLGAWTQSQGKCLLQLSCPPLSARQVQAEQMGAEANQVNSCPAPQLSARQQAGQTASADARAWPGSGGAHVDLQGRRPAGAGQRHQAGGRLLGAVLLLIRAGGLHSAWLSVQVKTLQAKEVQGLAAATKQVHAC